MYAIESVLVIFLLATLTLGLWGFRSVETMKDYVLANRSLSTGVLTMTLLTTFVQNAGLCTPDVAVVSGTATYLLGTLSFLFSFWFVGSVLAPRLLKLRDCLTLGDVMGVFYGENLKILAGLISVVVTCLIVAGHFKCLYAIIYQFVDPGDKTAQQAMVMIIFLLLIGSTILYTSLGGMWSVAITDVMQFVVAISAVSLIAWQLLCIVGGPAEVYETLLDQENKLRIYSEEAAVTSFLLFFPMMLAPPYLQRIFAAKHRQQVRDAFHLAAAMFMVFRSLFFIIGLGALSYYTTMHFAGNASVLTHLIKDMFSAYPFFQGFLVAGLVGVVMSTADSFLHAGAVSLAHDVLKPVLQRCGKVMSDEVGTAKGLCGLLGSVATFATYSPLHPSNAVLYSIMMLSTITLPLITGAFGLKVDAKSFYYALISGLLAYCLGFLLYYDRTFELDAYYNWMFALVVHTVVFLGSVYYNNGGFFWQRTGELGAGHDQGKLYLGSESSKGMSQPRCMIRASQECVRHFGYEPKLVGLFLAVTYIVPFLGVYAQGDGSPEANDFVMFAATLHLVGLMLCIGLLLQPYWPWNFRRFFPLFWYLTLLYCIPFSTALLVLKQPNNAMMGVSISINILLLTLLVGWNSFCMLAALGISMACIIHRIFYGVWISHDVILTDSLFMLGFAVIASLIIGYLFAARREQYQENRLHQTKLLGRSLGHEVSNHLDATLKTGQLIENYLSAPAKGPKDALTVSKKAFGALKELGVKLTLQTRKTHAVVKRLTKALGDEVPRVEPVPYALKEAVEAILDQSYFEQNEVKARLSYELSEDFYVSLPRVFLEHILVNLVKTAYAHEGAAKVTLVLNQEDRTLCVRDNGKGIPQSRLDNIFDTAAGKEDAGDLALVRKLVAYSGASISCASQQGKASYTAFIITFPETE